MNWQYSPRCALAALSVLAALFVAGDCPAQRDSESRNSQMREYLRSRVASRPNDASAWRMLGTYLLRSGDPRPAREAFERAVSIAPENAAVHFGLGECLAAQGEAANAARHFDLAVQIAPNSDYARRAQVQLDRLPPQTGVQQAAYEIRRFDGSGITDMLIEDQTDTILQPPSRWMIRVDVGALYNSNVALTPISRDFADVAQASAQAIFNPYIEYHIVSNDLWTIGPTFNSYFTINEEEAFGALNLQSYQPGFYFERLFYGDTAIHAARVQYDYTLDEFDGATFGNRHAATASLTSFWDSGDTSVLYWNTNYTDFTDDGLVPAASSRDGWSHTLGASHAWALDCWWIDTFTAGADLQFADVQGSDFRYFGGSVYLIAEKSITETLSVEIEGGWGYRDYFNSDIVPSRNEHVWRASARLRKQWSDRWSTSAVFTFDRFDSANELFQAERFLGGVIATFEF